MLLPHLAYGGVKNSQYNHRGLIGVWCACPICTLLQTSYFLHASVEHRWQLPTANGRIVMCTGWAHFNQGQVLQTRQAGRDTPIELSHARRSIWSPAAGCPSCVDMSKPKELRGSLTHSSSAASDCQVRCASKSWEPSKFQNQLVTLSRLADTNVKQHAFRQKKHSRVYTGSRRRAAAVANSS